LNKNNYQKNIEKNIEKLNYKYQSEYQIFIYSKKKDNYFIVETYFFEKKNKYLISEIKTSNINFDRIFFEIH
jgi:hypothetical protein